MSAPDATPRRRMPRWRRRALTGACAVCSGQRTLEVAHLVARTELPWRHPLRRDQRNLATLCRWCHLALDLYLGVTFARYHPHQPLDRLRGWFQANRDRYRPLLVRRERLRVELLDSGVL